MLIGAALYYSTSKSCILAKISKSAFRILHLVAAKEGCAAISARFAVNHYHPLMSHFTQLQRQASQVFLFFFHQQINQLPPLFFTGRLLHAQEEKQ